MTISDVSRILSHMQGGESNASEELLPIVYDELRQLAKAKMANESSDNTLQPTDLVHEAYVRLVNASNETCWNGRRHFFGAAAEAMRRILIEHARKRKSKKRGAEFRKQDLRSVQVAVHADPEGLLELNEALDLYSEHDPTGAELVKLRYFAGLTITEAADILGVSRSTAERTWSYARAWLFRRLSD